MAAGSTPVAAVPPSALNNNAGSMFPSPVVLLDGTAAAGWLEATIIAGCAPPVGAGAVPVGLVGAVPVGGMTGAGGAGELAGGCTPPPPPCRSGDRAPPPLLRTVKT